MPNWGYIWEFIDDDGSPVRTDTLLTEREVVNWHGYMRSGFRKLDETRRDRDAIDRAMRARKKIELPVMDAVGHRELREFWRRYRGNKDIERLIVELIRTRRAIREMEDLRKIVQTSWDELSNGSQLVALLKLRYLMKDEARRGDE
ncbi:hypothetical protein [Burkholderia cepacia]|uniref:hypothetical protein n=1 Tax=Burkholderia cepacia TaxID=292 RepID=UPI0015768307|nr:hypothetical protein [Burkholderia cepacia]